MSNTPITPQETPQTGGLIRVEAWRNLNLGQKLIFGFGLLVLVTLVVVGGSYFSSSSATEKINITEDLRVPTALDSANAQANLLRMLASTRGYLALGDQQYRADYEAARTAFEADLDTLSQRADDLGPQNAILLDELEAEFDAWSGLPEELFDLRDDQLQREPALRILLEDASDSYASVLQNISNMVEIQIKLALAADEIDSDQIELLKDMVNFQFSYGQMISGLRGYVTTRRPIFKSEYETQLRRNEAAWERLERNRDQMPLAQQQILDVIAENRAEFLEYPEAMFEILEDPDGLWRTDLYRFRLEAVPLTENMLGQLDTLTTDQQNNLRTDLSTGRRQLATARAITLFSGALAFVLGILLTFFFRAQIAGPVVRLTEVADRIRRGNLNEMATVESGDEIGILAATFNSMTTKLRDTLNQVRLEKNRADSLLKVVIPIGVDLTKEKDFNRLLENMLLEAKTFCKAKAGVVYLLDDTTLRPVIVRNDALDLALGGTTTNAIESEPLSVQNGAGQNHIAVQAVQQGQCVNVNHLTASDETLQVSSQDVSTAEKSYLADSFLSIPLKNNEGKILGVMQLIDAQDAESGAIIPFDANLQEMMESFSSLAVAALEAYMREQSLKQEIQRLRVEIDEAKREQQVQRIVESDSFRDIQAKAESFRKRSRDARRRNRRKREEGTSDSESPGDNDASTDET